MSAEDVLPGTTLEPELDEAAFLQRVKRRSIRRTVFISAAVGFLLFATAVALLVSWDRLILNQANRIDYYYADLVAISNPNTFVTGPSITRRQFPGASNEYTSYRLVGTRPVPAGDRAVDFDVWGGEQVRDQSERTVTQGNRVYVGSNLVPELRFRHPESAERAIRDGREPEDVELANQVVSETSATVAQLQALPASATVELAVSFDASVDYERMRALLPGDAQVLWGAVDTWGEGGPTVTMTGHMLGATFVQGNRGMSSDPMKPAEAEDALRSRLRMVIEHAPEGTAGNARESLEYIERRGVRYYGAVVVGEAGVFRKLHEREGIAALGLGMVLGPGEATLTAVER